MPQRPNASVDERCLDQQRDVTIVVLPSVTTSPSELQRTPGAEFLDERLLFTLLLLRQPSVHVVYVTSIAVDPAIIAYHLRLIGMPEAGLLRLCLVALDDPAPRALTHKLLDRSDVLARIRTQIQDVDRAYLLCYKTTPAEHRVAQILGIPLDGPEVSHLGLDSKSVARRIARRAGVAVLPGAEDLGSVQEVELALKRLRDRTPAPLAMVKLNEGFAGRGNAVVRLGEMVDGLDAASIELISAHETWDTFSAKIDEVGAVVEELLDRPGTVSSCVQMRIAPSGSVQLISAYDMLLAGERRQIYAGCSYPCSSGHRSAVERDAIRIAQTLASDGVRGWFGIDFVVDRSLPEPQPYLCEINLRMGGGTHPFWLALLASGGTYDASAGLICSDGRTKAYVATDDIALDVLVGRTAGEVIEIIDSAGLAFDVDRGHGVLLQFLGAVPRLGMLGMTCVADTPEEAHILQNGATRAIQDRLRARSTAARHANSDDAAASAVIHDR